MESTISTTLFFVAMIGGPLVAALLALAISRRPAWQVLLAAYLGEVVCTEAFRVWHVARLRALAAPEQFALLANTHSPSLFQRLLADLLPALIVGGIVLGARRWVRYRKSLPAPQQIV